MKIIVTGSLGAISQPLTALLVKKGHTVTVVSSNEEKRKEIEALGATAAIGSIEDVKFLADTFINADAVYCMAPHTLPGKEAATNYAEAIHQSGVKRVVHLSSWGAHLDKGTGFIVDRYYMEQILNGVPRIALTHIRPASFYYNLYMFMDSIKAAGFICAGYGEDDKTVLVAPADIADVIADELEQPIGSSVRYVASEETTCNEVARVLGEAIGKPMLQWIRLSDEQMKRSLEVKGRPPFVAAKLTELYAAHRTGLLSEDFYQNRPATLGKTKLVDFANEFAAVYNKS